MFVDVHDLVQTGAGTSLYYVRMKFSTFRSEAEVPYCEFLLCSIQVTIKTWSLVDEVKYLLQTLMLIYGSLLIKITINFTACFSSLYVTIQE